MKCFNTPCGPIKQQGMTLLEVMVALLIFALTGSAILKAAGDHLSNVGQVEAVNLKGEMPMAQRTWYWQQNVVKTNDDDLRAVTVKVGLQQDYSDSVTSVTTFVAKPTSGNR